MAIQLNLDQWPIVFTKFDGRQTLEELEHYIQSVNEVHARRQRYVGINYMKRYSSDAAQIARARRWLQETEQVTRDYCVACSMISESTGFRFVLSAIFVVKPMVCPYVVCGTFAHAEEFVRRIASARGLRLPSHIRNPWPELEIGASLRP
jgi:hypothetical protein